MPKLVMQIAKLEAPSIDAAGRKFGAKAYDTAGTKYTVPKAMFGMLQNGGWYEVFYEDKTFQGTAYKEIQTANATQPLASATHTGPGATVTPIVRARTPKEDEEQINRRHRLNWIGERMDAFAAQLPLTYEGLRPVSALLADIYDNLGSNTEEAAPRANGPAPGQQHAKDMDDEIPF
jgi:hypothetical protein